MSSRLGSLKPKEVIRKLKKYGFVEDHTTGSHIVFYNRTNGVRIVVPYHAREIKRGLLFAIIKQAELTVEEFQAL